MLMRLSNVAHGHLGNDCNDQSRSLSRNFAVNRSVIKTLIHLPSKAPRIADRLDGPPAIPAWNVYRFTANRRVSNKFAISGLSTSPNFRFLGQVQKFHCSLVDRRKW